MRLKQWAVWASCVAVLLAGRAAHAQQRLTYADCVERALRQNLQLKRALLDVEAATVRLKLQKTRLLPQVGGVVRNNLSVGRSIDPLTNGYVDRRFNSVTGGISSGVYLFEGFKTANAIKAAKQEVAQSTDQLQAIKNDVTVEVALAYMRINYLLELINSRQQQVEASAHLVALTKLKVNAGRVSESALFKVQAQQATEQLDVVNSQNELALAYLDLRQLINAPPTESLVFAPLEYPKALESEFRPPAPEEVVRTIEAQPALLASRHSAMRLYHQIAVARAEKLPALQLTGTLGSNYSNTNQTYDFRNQFNNNLFYGTGLVLSLPLFNGFRSNLLVRESRLRYQQGLLDVDIERNRITRVVQQAIADADAARQSWATARKAEEFARKSYEADQLKYEYGTISVFELNQSKAVYVNAQTDLFKAKYELILRTRLVGFYQGTALVL